MALQSGPRTRCWQGQSTMQPTQYIDGGTPGSYASKDNEEGGGGGGCDGVFNSAGGEDLQSIVPWHKSMLSEWILRLIGQRAGHSYERLRGGAAEIPAGCGPNRPNSAEEWGPGVENTTTALIARARHLFLAITPGAIYGSRVGIRIRGSNKYQSHPTVGQRRQLTSL